MSAPNVILELVDRFHCNLAACKQGKYNETQVRREFIDPFFRCGGVYSAGGASERDKQVMDS